MKHIFLIGVLIFSLLAVSNCKNDVSPSHITQTEIEKEPAQKPEKPEVLIPEAVQPETIPQGGEAGEGEHGEPPEVIPAEVTPPVIIPPEVIPPVVTPPQEDDDEEDETGEVVPPDDGTQGIETENEESETQEGEDKEDEEIVPPEIEKLDFAVLQINELRTEIGNLGNIAEYIEFKVLKGGGMEGLYLYNMINAQDTFLYIFPPIDVETGEYITLHLRELDKYKCLDELREDELSLSGGIDACPAARDLWVTGNNKLLNANSIVYIKDIYGRIMDAVVMNETPSAGWNNNQAYFAGILEYLFKAGMWKSADGEKPTPFDAVNTSAIKGSVYKSVSRYEGRVNTHSAKDWYIAGYITPGLPNK